MSEGYESRLADLTRQEAALRRLVAEVESQRADPQGAQQRIRELEAQLAELQRAPAPQQGSDPVGSDPVQDAPPPEPEPVPGTEVPGTETDALPRDLEQGSDPVGSDPVQHDSPREPPAAPESQIARIERAIAEAHAAGRPEAEEWAFYLPHLREHARPDGSLPPQFDALIESVFGTL